MEKKISVSRIFEAPVAMVWKLWTEPELVKSWWGPEHYSCPLAKMDFREGGTSLVCMQAPENRGGATHYSLWTYAKIAPLQSIELVQNLADPQGNKVKPVDVGMPPDFPEEIRTLVEFKELEKNKTEMTVTEFADFGQMSHFAQLGLEQSMAKMRL